MSTLRSVVTAVGLLLVAPSPALAQAQPACPPGLERGPDTWGQCCWAGQVWNGFECVGQPDRCPALMRIEPTGCVEVFAECSQDGQIVMPDQVHCCWPGQGWSSARGTCVGVPTCPDGLAPAGGGCVAIVEKEPPAPPAPEPAPEPTPAPDPAPPPTDAPLRVAPPGGPPPNGPAVEVSVGGGGTAFITNLENLRAGPGLAVGLAIHGDWVIGVETRVDWTSTETWHGGRVADYLTLHALLQVEPPEIPVAPVFLVGLGFQQYWIRENYRDGVPSNGDTLLRDPYLTVEQVAAGNLSYRWEDADFSLAIGGGVRIAPVRGFGLRFDVLVHQSIGEGSQEDSVPAWAEGDPSAVEWNDSFDHVTVTGRLWFAFGAGGRQRGEDPRW